MSLKTKIRKMFPGSKLVERDGMSIIKNVPTSTTLADFWQFRNYLIKEGELPAGGHVRFYFTEKRVELEWTGGE
jgi:hypothetical protein